jgi:hypothetical protein
MSRRISTEAIGRKLIVEGGRLRASPGPWRLLAYRGANLGWYVNPLWETA